MKSNQRRQPEVMLEVPVDSLKNVTEEKKIDS
jgi:hypothetical protein